ncbi:restriction endonuclease subunit S [Draconibacterium halophilum]|uniref:Restriction endonuclease subunit S n=1 Tax=Draconibacterium halophilum TaxID=2706887 RepID=A0A6C0RAL3_9BACT|nr:restriction endonuclease subunit S [Draconibacterium halophilum]QIA07127.1 restriction endonuclease subunit S [Draconibacterium halophilum]
MGYKYKKFQGRWLHKIPEEWEYVPTLRYLDSLVDYRGKTPKKVESGIFLVTAKNIKNGIINYELSKEYIEEDSYEEVMRRGKPEINDILFTTEAPLGEIALVDKVDVAFAQRIIKFRPRKEFINAIYFKYYLQSKFFQQSLLSLATGSTALGIKSSKLCLLRTLKPNISEQEQIANFLEYKTTQIDNLIEHKENLLKLLAEKRTAVITQAVTKGIEPNVEMTETGIDWLGEIPKNWKTVTLKWISSRYSGGTPDKTKPEFWYDGNIPWFNSGIVNNLFISEPSNYITEEGYIKSSAKYFEPGALLMALAGQGKTKGMVAQTMIKATCNQSLAVINITDQEPKFYLWWLNSKYKQIRGMSSQDGRDGLNLEMIGNIPCPIPPLNEQKRISDYIETEVRKIDSTNRKIQQSITQLKEYREALINAAVTGQIDVREENAYE